MSHSVALQHQKTPPVIVVVVLPLMKQAADYQHCKAVLKCHCEQYHVAESRFVQLKLLLALHDSVRN